MNKGIQMQTQNKTDEYSLVVKNWWNQYLIWWINNQFFPACHIQNYIVVSMQFEYKCMWNSCRCKLYAYCQRKAGTDREININWKCNIARYSNNRLLLMLSYVMLDLCTFVAHKHCHKPDFNSVWCAKCEEGKMKQIRICMDAFILLLTHKDRFELLELQRQDCLVFVRDPAVHAHHLYFQIFSNISKFCQIFPNVAKYISKNAKYFQMFSFQIFLNVAKYF